MSFHHRLDPGLQIRELKKEPIGKRDGEGLRREIYHQVLCHPTGPLSPWMDSSPGSPSPLSRFASFSVLRCERYDSRS